MKSLRKLISKFLASTVLILVAANAHAGPILTSGGLDWLALTDTLGLSPALALAANGGYRVATDTEVIAMWADEFGMAPAVGYQASNYPGAKDFVDLFGCTSSFAPTCAGPLAYSWGILADSLLYGTGSVRENEGTSLGLVSIGLSSLGNGNSQYGVFLVKGAVVPEPASLLLFGLGLAGIGFIRRKM